MSVHIVEARVTKTPDRRLPPVAARRPGQMPACRRAPKGCRSQAARMIPFGRRHVTADMVLALRPSMACGTAAKFAVILGRALIIGATARAASADGGTARRGIFVLTCRPAPSP